MMKLLNFRDLVKNEHFYYATVDVISGILWRRKRTRTIARVRPIGLWFFMENGESTPGFQAENLERVYVAKLVAEKSEVSAQLSEK